MLSTAACLYNAARNRRRIFYAQQIYLLNIRWSTITPAVGIQSGNLDHSHNSWNYSARSIVRPMYRPASAAYQGSITVCMTAVTTTSTAPWSPDWMNTKGRACARRTRGSTWTWSLKRKPSVLRIRHSRHWSASHFQKMLAKSMLLPPSSADASPSQESFTTKLRIDPFQTTPIVCVLLCRKGTPILEPNWSSRLRLHRSRSCSMRVWSAICWTNISHISRRVPLKAGRNLDINSLK